MIGEGHRWVDHHGVGLEVRRAEDVVDAHIDGIAIKGATDAVGGGTIGIRQASAHLMVSVRDGSIVEVAHEQDAIIAMTVEKGGKGVGLMGTLHTTRGYLAEQITLATDGMDVFRIVHKFVVIATFLRREVHRLEVGTDDDDRVTVTAQGREVEGCGTIARGATDGLGAMDGRFAHHCHAIAAKPHKLEVITRALHRGFEAVVLLRVVDIGLLQAGYVGLLGDEVAHEAEVFAIIVHLTVAEAHGVVRDDLECSLGGRRGEVDGAVVAQGAAAAEQSEEGDE